MRLKFRRKGYIAKLFLTRNFRGTNVTCPVEGLMPVSDNTENLQFE